MIDGQRERLRNGHATLMKRSNLCECATVDSHSLERYARDVNVPHKIAQPVLMWKQGDDFMSKELVMDCIGWVWFVSAIGVFALSLLYWRYTTRATSAYPIGVLDIEDVIFMVQILFVVWLAFHETFRMMSLYITSKITIW